VASNDMDRRMVLVQHELPMADSAQRRLTLAELKQELEGLDDRTRRKALLLVGALAAQGSMLGATRGQSMSLQVHRSADRLRIVARGGHDLPVDFWDVVGGAAATAFADDWQIERDRMGARFDIKRIDS
jgi:hypothetical protein